jgi:hypothetical protein
MVRVSTDTKSLIGYGILLLVAYESTVLIKLWFWVANSKLSVLKEIKQMRLDLAALTSPSALAPDREDLAEASPFQRTFTRKTRWLYIIALIAAVFLINGPLFTLVSRDAHALTSDGFVTVEADGTASLVTEMSYVHWGPMPMHTLTFHSGSPASVRWMDEAGRELPSQTSETEHGYRHDARLQRPVMPGDELYYMRLMPAVATMKDGVWTLEMDWTYGNHRNRFTEE